MKLTLSVTAPLFVDFIRSLFIVPIAFSLSYNRIKFFWSFFVDKVDVFHVNVYSFPFSFGSHFEQIHIYFLLNILLSPLIRANNYFRYNKPSQDVLKKKLLCKKRFYDMKCDSFELQVERILEKYLYRSC